MSFYEPKSQFWRKPNHWRETEERVFSNSGMDGLLPDVDYVNQRMGNLLDDHAHLQTKSQYRRPKFHQFLEASKHSSNQFESNSSPDKPLDVRSSLHLRSNEDCPCPELVQRIHAMRMRCQWYHHQQHQQEQFQQLIDQPNHSSTQSTDIPTITSDMCKFFTTSCSISPFPTSEVAEHVSLRPSSTSDSLITDVAYTTPIHLEDTIRLQQIQLLERLEKLKNHQKSPELENIESKGISRSPFSLDDSSSKSITLDVSVSQELSSNAHDLKVENYPIFSHKPRVQWVLKRRPDGSSFITRRSLKQQCSKGRNKPEANCNQPTSLSTSISSHSSLLNHSGCHSKEVHPSTNHAAVSQHLHLHSPMTGTEYCESEQYEEESDSEDVSDVSDVSNDAVNSDNEDNIENNHVRQRTHENGYTSIEPNAAMSAAKSFSSSSSSFIHTSHGASSSSTISHESERKSKLRARRTSHDNRQTLHEQRRKVNCDAPNNSATILTVITM